MCNLSDVWLLFLGNWNKSQHSTSLDSLGSNIKPNNRRCGIDTVYSFKMWWREMWWKKKEKTDFTAYQICPVCQNSDRSSREGRQELKIDRYTIKKIKVYHVFSEKTFVVDLENICSPNILYLMNILFILIHLLYFLFLA